MTCGSTSRPGRRPGTVVRGSACSGMPGGAGAVARMSMGMRGLRGIESVNSDGCLHTDATEPLSRAALGEYGGVSPCCQGRPHCERYVSSRLTPNRMPVPLTPCIHSSGWSSAPTSTSVACGPPPVELTHCAPPSRGAPFAFSSLFHVLRLHTSALPSPSALSQLSSPSACPAARRATGSSPGPRTTTDGVSDGSFAHPFAPVITHTPRRIIFHSQSAAVWETTLGAPGLSTYSLCTSTVTNPPRGGYPLGARSASWMTIGIHKQERPL